jgi:hypothetical protein
MTLRHVPVLSLLLLSQVAFSQKKCDQKQFLHSTTGRLYEEGCMVNGKRTGTWKEYTEDGTLRYEWTFVNNQKSGPYKAYYENGRVEATGKYYMGMLTDTVTTYDERGGLVSKTVWRPGNNGASTMVNQKIYKVNVRPDLTMEEVNGEQYIWMNGKREKVKSAATN